MAPYRAKNNADRSCALPLFAAARGTSGYVAVVEACIRLGGCSGSRAAVAGALAAAAEGLDAIPAAWLEQVHDADALVRDAVAALEARE